MGIFVGWVCGFVYWAYHAYLKGVWLSLLSRPCPLERGVTLSIEPPIPILKGCGFVYLACHAHLHGLWLCPLSLPCPFEKQKTLVVYACCDRRDCQSPDGAACT